MDVFIKRTTTLTATLGLSDQPKNGAAWHKLICAGFPYRALKSVAKALQIEENALAAALGLEGHKLGARKRVKRLEPSESDVLYAIARAYVHLTGFRSPASAAQWLNSPCTELKGAKPIELLTTRIGTEYVAGAIDRLRPKLQVREDPERTEPSSEDEGE